MSRSYAWRSRAGHTALLSATLAFQSLIALTALFFWALRADAADYYFNSRDEAAAACAQAATQWNSSPFYPAHQYGCRDQFQPGPPRFNGITTCCGGWETLRDQFFYAVSACTSGAQFSFPGICAPAKNNSRCSSSPDAASGSRGNPCNAATGNKFQIESDDVATFGLPITRYYNSEFQLDTGFGVGWTSTLQSKRLYVGTSSVQVVRADANVERFICSAGVCQGDPDTHLTLTQDGAGYTLTVDTDNTIERYNLSGTLLSHTDRAGRVTNYSYDASGRLASVTSPFGHSLTLAYGTNNHVTSVTDPVGQVIQYNYDVYDNLARVNYPDSTAKTYHYENTSFRNRLTGISFVDSTGNITRHSTYGYDATGKAVLTEHAGGVQRFSLVYDSATQTTVTDAASTREVMTFATNLGVKNLISNVNSGDGKSLAQTFDANNNLTCQKDEEGKVTTYTYNTTNQKTSTTEGLTGTCTSPVTTSATRTTTYQYLSPTLDLPTLVQSPSVAAGQTKSTVIQYTDAAHPNLPTQITQSGFKPDGTAVSRSIALGYNASGQVSSINGPRTDVSDITTLTYNTCTTGGACGQLQTITNAVGHITTFDTYDASGRVTQTRDPNGLRTNYVYDARGRVLTITQTPPTGTARTTSYTYNAAGNITSTTFPDGRVLTYTYSAAQKLTRITDNLGNRIDYTYDLKGNRTQEQTVDPDGTLVRSIDVAYDVRNRTASINAGGSLTQTVHDAIGNLVSTTDPKANPATTHQYDALNRLMQTLDALGGTTAYGYDTTDRLTQVRAANNATTQYQYDDLGNLLQEISPDRGTTTYTYDGAGNVITQTDARSIVVSYSYDALNRVTAIDYPTDTDVTYTYDVGPNCTLGIGRLCQVIDESGTTQYTYDAFGNQTEQRKVELTRAYTTRYTYDAGNRITTITYPDNRIITYARDSIGRILNITATVNGTTQTIVSARTYRADNLFLSQTYGNGLNELRQYDLKGNLTYQSLGTADTRVYTYDVNGNLTQKQSLPEVGNYLYDPLDRLTRDQIVTGTTSNQVYVYDANGNRTKKASTNYTYTPSTNRLIQTGTTQLTLDAAGNTLTNGALNYTYNNAGRLRQAYNGTTLRGTYTYNHLGQRTRKVAGTTTTIYHYDLDGNLILETSQTAVARAAYVHADTNPIGQVRRSGTTDTLVYLHTDHEGTPRFATNTGGVKVWFWEGRAFGDTNPNQNPDGDTITTTVNLRYPGMYADAESGLFYNWYRYYSPALGRYVTSDPIGLQGGLNTYAYVDNNPLRWVDPEGLMGRGSGANAAKPVWPPGRGPNAQGVSPNGNYSPGYQPQTPGCDSFPDVNGCVSKCCEEHDRCYEQYGCNASSWNGNFPGGYSGACQMCNTAAMSCVIRNLNNFRKDCDYNCKQQR